MFNERRTRDKLLINRQKLWIYEFTKWLGRPFILAKIANLMIIYPIKEKREKKTLKIRKNY